MKKRPCNRADLIAILYRRDARLTNRSAGLFGFAGELLTDEPKPAPAPKRPLPPPPPTKSEPPKPLSAPPVPFWRLEAIEYREDQAASDDPEDGDEEIEPVVWSDNQGIPPRIEPLTNWRELQPQLRRGLAALRETRDVDVPAVVRSICQGRSFSRVPKRRRRQWGSGLVIIEDRSDRLIPYREDQAAVRTQLARLFPRHQFSVALYWEGLERPVPARASDAAWQDGSALPGETVVVLGDLGCLAGEPAVAEYWAELGRQLSGAGCRTFALSPARASACATKVREQWQIATWEGLSHVGQQFVDDIERLLTLVSRASRLDPGSVRAIRRKAGMSAAVEAAFWQHPALTSNSSVAATMDAAFSQRRRAAFDQDPLNTTV